MSYLGKTQFKSSDVQRFDVTSSTSATHVLSWTAPNEQSLIVTINGVKQQDDAYSIAGSPTTVTLTSALVATDKLEIVGIVDVGTMNVPGVGSVQTDLLADNAVTLAKLEDGTQGDILYYGASGAPTRLGYGTSGDFLKTQGTGANPAWATAPGGLFASYAIIADQKAQNTAGGTFTSGAWRTRDLNTEITDPDGIVSISSNEFTLAAGSYFIQWGASARRCDRQQTRLYDVTGTAEIEVGDCCYSRAADYGGNFSRGSVRVTPSGSNVYRIEHQCDTTSSADGLGLACNFTTEQYCTVEIFKEA